MKKLFIICVYLIVSTLDVFAYEDCVMTTDGKITDIKIQNNNIIDVFPLITIMNDKNTVVIHPLKEGVSKLSILKNNKDRYIFDVKVDSKRTYVSENKGFEIFTIDCPPVEQYYELDEPPQIKTVPNNGIGVDIDEPPSFNERRKRE